MVRSCLCVCAAVLLFTLHVPFSSHFPAGFPLSPISRVPASCESRLKLPVPLVCCALPALSSLAGMSAPVSSRVLFVPSACPRVDPPVLAHSHVAVKKHPLPSACPCVDPPVLAHLHVAVQKHPLNITPTGVP
eukprot:2509091-Pleurochrysis_carterae.AAC.1